MDGTVRILGKLGGVGIDWKILKMQGEEGAG
jgi:hypothetical protein